MKGFVISVLAERGFGFIRGDLEEDIFFHKDELVPPLVFEPQLHQREVEFKLGRNSKGQPLAVRVTAARQ